MLIPAVVGPILGPPIGGFIVTYLNWRWIFYINVPIGILGIILVSLFIANTRGEVPEKTDYCRHLPVQPVAGTAACSASS